MLKIAIVGTGIIVKSHLAAINQLDDVELVALCDVNEEKAKTFSEQCGVPYVLDYKEMPSKFDFDAVILNLPHGLHCEAAVFFLGLRVGKHSLSVKAMTADKTVAGEEVSDLNMILLTNTEDFISTVSHTVH